MKLSIAVDIGGTLIKASLLSEEGTLLKDLSQPTQSEQGAERIFQSIQKICDLFLKTKFSSQIRVIGIGSPGRVSLKKKCVVEGAYQLRGWKNFPFVQKLSEHYQLPVFADNDANLMSYGEFRFGAAQGAENAICITLGTGIGGGIILNKALYRGSFEYSGEVGHMIIHPQGRLCQCGSRGCWEAYASATGLITEGKEQHFSPKKKWNTHDIFIAAQKKKPLALKILKNYIHNLSFGIINLIRIFDPEIFVIGGGISSSKEFLLTPLLSEIKNLQRNNNASQKCVIKIAKLGNKAGVIGASAFAFDCLKKNIHSN